jgi:hypothetical protein
MGNSNADSDSNWTDSDSSDSEFEMDPKEEAELKALHDAMIKEQTVHDRKTASRFYQLLEKTNTRSKWKTVIRYPRIDGKNYMERDVKNPPKVNLWRPGHEIKKVKDHFFWACLYIRTYPDLAMYVHHSMAVHRDGRLIGTMQGGMEGFMIDVQEINKALDVWSDELKDSGKKYWDEVE